MRKIKQTTTTSLVLGALRATDDFLDYRALRAMTGRNTNQISAACHELRNHRCVDVVVEPDGRGWWFALPAEQDTRCRSIDERTPESKPRRPRRPTNKPSE